MGVLMQILNPVTFLLMLMGLLVGIIFGMIPGLTGITAIAVLTPFTYGMDTITALVLMAAVYCGAVYAGSISAILFNCPGDVSSIMTAVDGYPMRRKGQPEKALLAAMTSSGIGGIIGVVIAWIGAMSLVRLVFKFGPPEYFALATMGLALVAIIGAKHIVKGLISVVLGLLISTVGMDYITGLPRFTFHMVNLSSGIPFVPAIIGLYAVGETLNQFTKLNERREIEKLSKGEKLSKFTFFTKDEVKLCLPHWIRNSFVGCAIGMLPGAGSTIAACVGYGLSRVFSKKREEFGKGTLEGVVGPETANNASVGGAMVPLLTMGIPGSTCAALILNIFLIHGLQPGPFLFVNQPEFASSIFISMLISNVMIIFIPIILIRYIVKILQVPYEYMGAVIIFVAMVGAFSLNNRIYDVWVTVIFGVLGYIMLRYEYSPAALTLGMILGPMLEKGVRQSLMMFGGDFTLFLERPIALAMLAVALMVIILPNLGLFFKNITVLSSQK
jgi:putative tricarboxylic transport membrane protein